MSDGSQSSEVVPSQEKKEAEIDTGLIEKDGAIGFYKDRTFQALTNFSIACKGFVSNGSMVNGYLIEVIPASCQCVDGGIVKTSCSQSEISFCRHVKKELVHTFSCAYIELWMHLGSLESTQEARVDSIYAR